MGRVTDLLNLTGHTYQLNLPMVFAQLQNKLKISSLPLKMPSSTDSRKHLENMIPHSQMLRGRIVLAILWVRDKCYMYANIGNIRQNGRLLNQLLPAYLQEFTDKNILWFGYHAKMFQDESQTFQDSCLNHHIKSLTKIKICSLVSNPILLSIWWISCPINPGSVRFRLPLLPCWPGQIFVTTHYILFLSLLKEFLCIDKNSDFSVKHIVFMFSLMLFLGAKMNF